MVTTCRISSLRVIFENDYTIKNRNVDKKLIEFINYINYVAQFKKRHKLFKIFQKE